MFGNCSPMLWVIDNAWSSASLAFLPLCRMFKCPIALPLLHLGFFTSILILNSLNMDCVGSGNYHDWYSRYSFLNYDSVVLLSLEILLHCLHCLSLFFFLTDFLTLFLEYLLLYVYRLFDIIPILGHLPPDFSFLLSSSVHILLTYMKGHSFLSWYQSFI